jgi:putative membrane protein
VTIDRVTHAALFAGVLLAPVRAGAHPGAPPAPHDLWRAWQGGPAVIASLVLGALAYYLGARALRARTGNGRGLARWRAYCYWAAIATLAIALVSPLHAAGEALFSAHMVQHLLLTMVAAPLLVLGDAGTALLWALPLGGRRAVGAVLRAAPVRATWRVLRHPLAAWGLHAVALLAWHLPALYERAVRDDATHALEHLSFLLTAVLYWWAVLAPRPRARMGFGAAMLYLFTGALASTLLGAALAVSDTPWYRVHARSTLAWGLTALEDQQLAGLVMWVPAGLVYLMVMVPMVVAALSEREARILRA